MNRHFICTREEAKKMIAKQTNFWVSNCECKLYNTNPNKVDSMDVCLFFQEKNDLEEKDLQKISKEDVLELFLVAKQTRTIIKAFRNQNLLKTIGGICFCSHECFGYFKEKNATYDKGKSIEKTDFDRCSNCGVCINICEFHARKMVDEQLTVDQNVCYGCGLCADVCPMECIDMVARKR